MIHVHPATCTVADLTTACEWVAAGGIVAYPTDTFYGLAVDPTMDAAVAALFDLKGRDPRMAMPLVAASVEQAAGLAVLDDVSWRLADAFWPGPLSLVLEASARVAAAVHAGRQTVAIRVPAHRVAQALASGCGTPITSTSANRSGAPPVSSVTDLGLIAKDPRVLVIDGGATAGGLPSTIVDARAVPATLVREGAIPWSRVLDFLNG